MTGRAGSGPTSEQHRHMHALWKVAGVTDRDDRLALTSSIVGRPLTTSNQMDTAGRGRRD